MEPFSPCKVLCWLYGWLHPLDSEEGGQVGGVGADHDQGDNNNNNNNNNIKNNYIPDHDQGEEPPQRRDHPGGEGSEDHYEYLWIMDAEKSAV